MTKRNTGLSQITGHCITISRLPTLISFGRGDADKHLLGSAGANLALQLGIRLIVILRNPIERAYSHWAWSTGKRSAAFARPGTGRGAAALPYSMSLLYVDRGFYSAQLGDSGVSARQGTGAGDRQEELRQSQSVWTRSGSI